MTRIRSLAFSGTVLAMLLGLAPMAAQAEEPVDMSAVQLQPQQQNGITYLSGGIGLDESTVMKQTQGYNLRLTFATGPEDKYLPGVNVAIQKLNGQPVLSVNDVGPYFFVNLPPDQYMIISNSNGQEKRQNVAVDGSGVKTVVFHWAQEP